MTSNFEKLREFAKEIFMLADWPEGNGIDGGEFQDVAVKHGLLIEEIRHAPCGDECPCASCCNEEDFKRGVQCYQQVEWLFATSDNYQRPELEEKDLIQARMDVAKLVRKYYRSRDQIIELLAIENVRLVKEVNEHRAARGIEPLPTFEV